MNFNNTRNRSQGFVKDNFKQPGLVDLENI